MIAEFVIKNFTRYFIIFIPEMKTLTRFKLWLSLCSSYIINLLFLSVVEVTSNIVLV